MLISPSDDVKLLAIGTALPIHRVSQAEVLTILVQAKGRDLPPRLAEILGNTGIDQRYLAMPPEYYMEPRSWAARALAYADSATDLFRRATIAALTKAQLKPADIGQIVFVSTTGTMTPSIPSRMIAEMGFDAKTRALPLFGYGCAGGVIGLGIAADLFRAEPYRPVLLVSIELCSLAYDHARMDKKDMVATALFGDGAAAAVIGAGTGAGIAPNLAAFTQHTWPDTLDMMGWDIGETGYDLVLARDIPAFVSSHFAPACDAFLIENNLAKSDMAEPACHPGGGRVVDALADYIGDDLPATRAVLRANGNMSSPTVLFVLEQILAHGPVTKPMLMTALGPGFVGAIGLLLP